MCSMDLELPFHTQRSFDLLYSGPLPPFDVAAGPMHQTRCHSICDSTGALASHCSTASSISPLSDRSSGSCSTLTSHISNSTRSSGMTMSSQSSSRVRHRISVNGHRADQQSSKHARAIAYWLQKVANNPPATSRGKLDSKPTSTTTSRQRGTAPIRTRSSSAGVFVRQLSDSHQLLAARLQTLETAVQQLNQPSPAAAPPTVSQAQQQQLELLQQSHPDLWTSTNARLDDLQLSVERLLQLHSSDVHASHTTAAPHCCCPARHDPVPDRAQQPTSPCRNPTPPSATAEAVSVTQLDSLHATLAELQAELRELRALQEAKDDVQTASSDTTPASTRPPTPTPSPPQGPMAFSGASLIEHSYGWPEPSVDLDTTSGCVTGPAPPFNMLGLPCPAPASSGKAAVSISTQTSQDYDRCGCTSAQTDTYDPSQSAETDAAGQEWGDAAAPSRACGAGSTSSRDSVATASAAAADNLSAVAAADVTSKQVVSHTPDPPRTPSMGPGATYPARILLSPGLVPIRPADRAVPADETGVDLLELWNDLWSASSHPQHHPARRLHM